MIINSLSLVAYIMKPKAGYDYLATAAHFAAESSTGTNVNVCTTDDFTKCVRIRVAFTREHVFVQSYFRAGY